MDSTSTFPVIRARRIDGRVLGRLEHATLEDIDGGEVLVRVAHCGINYKDALAVTGRAPVLRRLPCIVGIEAVGRVEESADPRFPRGTEVVVHGLGLGVERDGGFSAYLRVPGDWLLPRPPGLNAFEAATIGVAGYTAALAIDRMEHNGLAPGQGPVAVTGATGGVASLGIAMLAAAGYEVVAITGKEDCHDYLRGLGASGVLSRAAVESAGKPLRSARWAGALDAVGGETLPWLMSTMRESAPIAVLGNAAGSGFTGNVLPLLLRGVQVLGIQANSPMPLRRRIWSRIAGDLRPHGLDAIGTALGIEDVLAVCERQIRGGIRGRSVLGFA